MEQQGFPSINRGYNNSFKAKRLSLGLVVPIEAYAVGELPSLTRHIERVQLAESLGFSAAWLRDVPFHVPSFGDPGHVLDPFVYLGALAATTSEIGLGVASIVLPLRHPVHVAKAAASVDQLSGGRLLLGVASGDRPEEYPAMAANYDDRAERFRESFASLRALAQDFPRFENRYGALAGNIDMVPKPHGSRIPLLITGSSRQTEQWRAQHGDGWMTYPRGPEQQAAVIGSYRTQIEDAGALPKPVMQSLYIDLVSDANAGPRPIHLGFRAGINFLTQYLKTLEGMGVNHVALNLRFQSGDIESVLKTLGEQLIPRFPSKTND